MLKNKEFNVGDVVYLRKDASKLYPILKTLGWYKDINNIPLVVQWIEEEEGNKISVRREGDLQEIGYLLPSKAFKRTNGKTPVRLKEGDIVMFKKSWWSFATMTECLKIRSVIDLLFPSRDLITITTKPHKLGPQINDGDPDLVRFSGYYIPRKVLYKVSLPNIIKQFNN